MKKVVKLTRISAKRYFKQLRAKSPILCTVLNKEVQITTIYFQHISWKSKVRKIKEVVLRLLMINLIDEILEKWKLSEKREKEKFIYYEIQYKIEWEVFCLVLSEMKKTWSLTLFSSFIK